MKTWCTEIRAINPVTGELTTFCGPNIQAPSWALAEEYLQNNGLGYCRIDGELVAEIPCKPGTYEPDWDNMIDYENIQNN